MTAKNSPLEATNGQTARRDHGQGCSRGPSVAREGGPPLRSRRWLACWLASITTLERFGPGVKKNQEIEVQLSVVCRLSHEESALARSLGLEWLETTTTWLADVDIFALPFSGMSTVRTRSAFALTLYGRTPFLSSSQFSLHEFRTVQYCPSVQECKTVHHCSCAHHTSLLRWSGAVQHCH